MGLCLPRRRRATSLATRPRTLSVASITNHSCFTSAGLALKVFMVSQSLWMPGRISPLWCIACMTRDAGGLSRLCCECTRWHGASGCRASGGLARRTLVLLLCVHFLQRVHLQYVHLQQNMGLQQFISGGRKTGEHAILHATPVLGKASRPDAVAALAISAVGSIFVALQHFDGSL